MIKPLPFNVSRPSSGESRCKTAPALRVELQNLPLQEGWIEDFCEYIGPVWPLAPKVDVTLSSRETKWRWGTAWPTQRRMTLYRHSVGIFLHELAHLMVPQRNGHNRVFATCLDGLINMWLDFQREDR